MATGHFAKVYAASLETFGADLELTIANFQPLSQWRARQELETRAVLGAVVMIVVVSTDLGEHPRDALLAQILSALWALPCESGRACLPARAALLERAAGYYALRDPEDHRTTGVRFVGAYLDAVGMPLSAVSAMPVRYLASRFACRILGDLSRMGELRRCEGRPNRNVTTTI